MPSCHFSQDLNYGMACSTNSQKEGSNEEAQLVIPQKLKGVVPQVAHDLLITRHLATRKTLARVIQVLLARNT